MRVRILLVALLFLLGVSSVVAGCFLVYRPLGFLVLGAVLIVWALAWDKEIEKTKKEQTERARTKSPSAVQMEQERDEAVESEPYNLQ